MKGVSGRLNILKKRLAFSVPKATKPFKFQTLLIT